jgi:hypothetical protein
VIRTNGVIDNLIGNKRMRGRFKFQSSLHDVIGIAWGLTIATPGISEEVRRN